MSQKQIFIPSQLNLWNTIQFTNQLFIEKAHDEFIIDFCALRWVEPFSLLYLSVALRKFRDKHLSSRMCLQNYLSGNANNYAAHMGFFKAFGVDIGKNPGEAPGNKQYIPIKILNTNTLKKKAEEDYLHVAEATENLSRELAIVLSQQDEGNLVDLLEFSIREIIRNIIEHSGASRFGFCAQYWTQKNKVELSLLDTGIGLKKGLENNPFLDLSDEKAALHYALLPGVSGKVYKGVKIRKHDVWQNSGFGLYMTSEICRDGGNFFLCSNSFGIFLENEQKTIIPVKINGTALRLIIDTSKLVSLNERLSNYRQKGQKIAASIKGANINASEASSMVSRRALTS